MTLTDLSSTFMETLTTWLKNFIYIILTPLVNVIFSVFPDFSRFVQIISQLLAIISNYMNYILDATLLYNLTLIYVVGSIIFRITIKTETYVGKLILKYWEALT